MQQAQLSAKGQVTIPKNIRQNLGVKQGDYIFFVATKNGINVINERERKERLQRNAERFEFVQKNFDGLAEDLGVQTDEDVVALIREYRKEKFK